MNGAHSLQKSRSVEIEITFLVNPIISRKLNNLDMDYVIEIGK